jgi:hypothetical protein
MVLGARMTRRLSLLAPFRTRAFVFSECTIDVVQVRCPAFFSSDFLEHGIRGGVAHAQDRVRLPLVAVSLNPARATPDACTNDVRPFHLVYPSRPPAAGTPRPAIVAQHVGHERQWVEDNLYAA